MGAMQNADTGVPPDWQGVRVQEGVRVEYDQDRLLVGSCNACTTVSRDRNAHETVTQVHLRGMSFRLCCRCRAKLKELL